MVTTMRARSLLVRLATIAAITSSAFAVAATPAHAVEGPWFDQHSGAAYNVNGTYTPLIGDFAGTSSDDILFYAPGTGTDSLWTSSGTGSFSKANLAMQVNGTYTPLVGDFGGDQRDDIFWYGPGATKDFLWITHDGSFTQVAENVSGTYTPFVLPDTQFTPAANDDIMWWKAGTGGGSVWSFTGSTGAHTAVGAPIAGSPKPVVGDFDGNGSADVFWYTAGSTPEALWRGNGAGHFTKSGFNIGGTYTPVVEDFTPERDGRSDIVWFTTTGFDSLWEGTAAGGFATSSHPIAGTGTPLPLLSEWGYIWSYSPTTPDRCWYTNGAVKLVRTHGSQPQGEAVGDDYDEQCGNTELGAGYRPLIGTFTSTSDEDAIFWYKPGSAPEYLFDFDPTVMTKS